MRVTRITGDWRLFEVEKRPGKSVCVVRYGGFGDMIQMSSILPGLKAQEYYVVVNTMPRGYDIIKHDPNIDEVILQEHDQVPNEFLGELWEKLSSGVDKFVQLSESIEGALLALPGRKEYKWSTKKRHRIMNRDYYAVTHNIAGVPLPPKPAFYPSPNEIQKAHDYLDTIGPAFVIMWCLSGSSVHKAWPYTDSVIARLMFEYPDVHVIFVGEPLCQLLTEQWAVESRVHCECGKMDIRDTLTLAQRVNLVIGPETGVLNAVAFDDVKKIIMLSHSSPVNIGGSWINTKVMVPRHVKCWPCHQLHYGWSTCNRDEITGGAMCAASIRPISIYNAIKRAMS